MFEVSHSSRGILVKVTELTFRVNNAISYYLNFALILNNYGLECISVIYAERSLQGKIQVLVKLLNR